MTATGFDPATTLLVTNTQPYSQTDQNFQLNNMYFFSNLTDFKDKYSKNYKNDSIMDDFNLEPNETAIDSFI